MKQRIVFLDFVRVFACFLVILVHACENYYASAAPGELAGPVTWLDNETDHLWVSVYDGFSRMAVPLFIIVSAYLLVPMPKNVTMGGFYRKRFTRILPPALIFMVLYAVLPLAWGGTDAARATSDFLSIPLNFPELAGHLWFLYPLVSIYLFTPMISPWLYQATKRQEQFFIALFAISTLMPYLNHWFGYVWGECFWNQYHMLWYFSGYLGYVVAAHYIRVHLAWSRSKRVAVGLPMLLVGAAATIWSFYAQTTVQALIPTPEAELGWSFCTINVLVLTLGAFLLFSCIELKTTPAPVLQLSRLSYAIYLMHIFWLLLVVSIIKEDMNLASPIAIPLIAVVTFCLCWATARLLAYLPCSLWLGIEKPKK